MATPTMNVSKTSYPGKMGTEGAVRYVFSAARLALSGIFLWAFADKTFGLGYSTKAANAWINGGSPTRGFLSGTKGWFSGTFHAIAGNVVVDWLFMAALLGIGLALLLGIGMRVAAASGATLMGLMYLAAVPGVTGISNPVIDDHVVYGLVLVGLALMHAGDTIGFGRYWRNLSIVKRYPILE